MCGIVGIIQFNNEPVSRKVVESMTLALSHRGPDGWGTEVWPKVGLGHRRLAIIDLERGKQPLSNEDQQVWVTFNGEIYNYRQLRHELQAKGHIFRTNSDTETIVHAYEEWGERCVERFRGMFAFGLVDFKNRKLFVARDQLGIKPLYYLHTAHCFAFASELQAFHSLPNVRLKLDLQAIDQYLWLQYIPAPKTIFKQIHKLPPAHRMSVTFDRNFSEPEEYWRLEFRPEHNRSEAEWLEGLDNVLRDSVRAHLVSDVPFGAFLSGGVDSSAVVAYMAQILNKPVRTFSIGFEEEQYNELNYAQLVAERWETEHHVEIVRPNALEILPKLVQHYGEPFGDSSALPTFYVSQLARQSVPMILSGDGGDEAFAGYHSYHYWMRWMSDDGLPKPPAWKRLLYPVAQRLLPHRYPPPRSREPTLSNWLACINYMPTPLRQSLRRAEYQSLFVPQIDTFSKEFARTKEYSLSHKVQFMDIKTYLTYDILTKVDIASMMHGLEVRTPLTDIRVMEFAATIPQSMSIGKNRAGQWEGKLLLKKAMQRYYPTEFLHRPKKGFRVPIQIWLASDNAWQQKIQERLLGPDSTLFEFFNQSAIKKLVKKNASSSLWLLLFLDEWLRQNR